MYNYIPPKKDGNFTIRAMCLMIITGVLLALSL